MIQEEVRIKDPKTQEELQSLMIKVMKKTVGQVTINIGNNKSKESKEIKRLRETKKEAKKEYEKAIKEKIDVPLKRNNYINSQIRLREEIETENKLNTKRNLQKLIKEGGNKSMKFWKMRH